MNVALYTQATHIPGRIETVESEFYRGKSVTAGKHLAIIYSPALVTAQEELLQAQEIKRVSAGTFCCGQTKTEKLEDW